MKLSDFFKKKTSSDVAKDRLKLVLVSDRATCSPEIMQRIRSDIIEVLSKYAEIDMDGIDINFTHIDTDENDGKSVPALYANIPIKNMNHTPKKKFGVQKWIPIFFRKYNLDVIFYCENLQKFEKL